MEAFLIEQWLPISQFTNSVNCSLGLHDSYPLVVPAPVFTMLEFIHRAIGAVTRGEAANALCPGYAGFLRTLQRSCWRHPWGHRSQGECMCETAANAFARLDAQRATCTSRQTRDSRLP